MRCRSTLSVLLAVGILLAMAVPALAGGWAITAFDPLPEQFVAGETYKLGYTVLQHGDKPVPGERTAIRIWSAGGGETLRFAGTAEGAAGHYVAEVRFPSAGAWSWEVEQGPFGPQQLGSITVAAPQLAPPAEQTATAPRGSFAWPSGLMLPAATIVAVVALAAWGIASRRRLRSAWARQGTD